MPGAGRVARLTWAGIHALGASLELSVPGHSHHCESRSRIDGLPLCEQAMRFGLMVYSSRESGEQSGIVSILGTNLEPSALVRRCKGEGIIINQRVGAFASALIAITRLRR